jgi:hypothetical protein
MVVVVVVSSSWEGREGRKKEERDARAEDQWSEVLTV